MTQIKDGGPAFPLQSIGPDFAPGYAGMTLRDYFAAKFMQGFVSSCATVEQKEELAATNGIAMCAYDMADAMMREREE